ncbi:EF-hand domain-containing protein [Rhizobium herbae]|uniref:Ca2+-binding EF-hand superfamily protein n=1 Tax=Rhizobium herbae TaxID=508661 RepID=A0ABS4EJI9_9HYPH|nr:EF-hand domain-containing protein [Rhizobium herbae]MBP1858103.1 Ca2+-binding EF-hand superfamily protein [Rhizobium herbae]
MRKNTLILGVVAASLTLTGFVAPTFAARQKPTPEQRAEWMIKRLDTNGDNKVSLDEVQARTTDAFKTFDADGNGQVTRDEIKAKRQAFREARKEMRATRDKTGEDKTVAMEKLREMRPAMLPGMRHKAFKRVDTDNSGSLSLAEVTEQAGKMFKRRDANGDGFIDAADFTKKI